MPNFGIWEWLVILVIVLVIFGASRLKDIGSGLGGAINAFRQEVKQGREDEEGEGEDKAKSTSQETAAPQVEKEES